MCTADCAPTLTSGRIHLRPLRAADAAAITRYVSDWDVARMTSRIPHPYGPGEAETFLDIMARSPCPPTFAIADEDDALIGAIGFHELDAYGAPEIGYWLGKPYWGQGLATEAVGAALAWARDGWGRKVVRAKHFADNPASGQVLIKSDFLYTGDISRTRSVARDQDVDLREMVWIA